jgi:WD40 repeat protein
MYKHAKHRHKACLIFIVYGMPTTITNAQDCIPETFKLLDPNGNSFDYFGRSVAISEEAIVVGAYMDDEFGPNSGSASIFNIVTGELLSKLLPDAHSANDNFGYSVSIDGSMTIVGSPTDDERGTDAGSAYIYNSHTGDLIVKIYSEQNYSTEHFGYSVSINNNLAIVGAPWSSQNGSLSGAAYLYDNKTGKQITTFLPEVGHEYDQFGTAVGISGTTVVVGASNTNSYGSFSGAAYLFDTLTGKQAAKLTPLGVEKTDGYGISVAIDGNTAIVGAPFDDDVAEDAGAAYLFSTITGELIAKIKPPNGVIRDHFGMSVSISGTTAVIGSPQSDVTQPNGGSIYLFDILSGEFIAQYFASDAQPGDRFGTSVAINNFAVISGAISDDDNGQNSGAAYVYSTSNPAACAADIISDCTLDVLDIGGFIVLFEHMDPAADFTNDGVWDFFDVSAFLAAFTTGCP